MRCAAFIGLPHSPQNFRSLSKSRVAVRADEVAAATSSPRLERPARARLPWPAAESCFSAVDFRQHSRPVPFADPSWSADNRCRRACPRDIRTAGRAGSRRSPPCAHPDAANGRDRLRFRQVLGPHAEDEHDHDDRDDAGNGDDRIIILVQVRQVFLDLVVVLAPARGSSITIAPRSVSGLRLAVACGRTSTITSSAECQRSRTERSSRRRSAAPDRCPCRTRG